MKKYGRPTFMSRLEQADKKINKNTYLIVKFNYVKNYLNFC